MSNNYRRGRYAEYKLMLLLKNSGYFVLRAPASGSRVKRFNYIDVIAIKRGIILLFEVKRKMQRDTITIRKEQIEKLKRAEELTGGHAYIAVYIDEDKKFYVFTLDQLEDRGNHYLLSAYEFDNAKQLDDVKNLNTIETEKIV